MCVILHILKYVFVLKVKSYARRLMLFIGPDCCLNFTQIHKIANILTFDIKCLF